MSGSLDNVSAATKLRREQMDVQQELDQKRNESKERMDQVRDREQQIARKRQDLQERLVRFYKFIQENEIKKNRADKKALAEEKAKAEKHEQIVQLNEESRRLEREKQEIKEKLQKYLRYQKYLDDVLQVNDEYSDPSDIIARWKTLDGNHKELQARKEYLEKQTESTKQMLHKKKENKATEILEFTNALASTNQKLEELRKEVMNAQDDIERTVEQKARTTRTIGQVRMATQNLYDRCTEHAGKFHKVRTHSAEDNDEEILHQLQYIGESLGDYFHIRERHRDEQRAKKAVAAPGQPRGRARRQDHDD